MEATVRFKILGEDGKTKHVNKKITCPDFEVIPATVFMGWPIPETPIESQVIDWLDEQDKFDLMIEMDAHVIIDYFMPTVKKAKVTVVDAVKTLDLSEKMFFDLMAVYAKIKDSIKGMSTEKQIEMLFSHASIGYDASSNAYARISAILDGKDPDLVPDGIKELQ